MPNVFEWYVPERVILGHSVGDIVEQDLIEQNRIVIDMIESGQAPVHLLFNLEPQNKVLVPMMTLVKYATYLKHPKFGWGVTYGKLDNPFVRMMTSVVAQTTGVRNRQYETYAEALKFFREIDPTLEFEGLNPPTLHAEVEFGTSFFNS